MKSQKSAIKPLIILLIVSLFFSGCLLSTHQNSEKIKPDLLRAQELINREKYSEAALIYEELINRYEIENSALFFNTGNCFYKSGNLGKAIFYYLRAEKIDPGNKKIKANLNKLRAERDGNKNNINPSSLYSIINSVVSVIPLYIRILILTLSSAFFWILLILRQIKGIAVKKIYFYLLAFFVILFGLFFAFDISKNFKSPEGVIILETEGRTGDSNSAESSFSSPLTPGMEFTVKRERSGWLFISLKEGGECWIDSASAGIIRY